jgi:hypothetical protein
MGVTGSRNTVCAGPARFHVAQFVDETPSLGLGLT